MTRRCFLKTNATLAVAVPSLSPRLVWSADPPPSERLTLGFIGTGYEGNHLLKGFLRKREAQIVAVCDVDTSRREYHANLVNEYYAAWCDLPGEAMERGLDWDLWLGPAPMRSYHHELSPRRDPVKIKGGVTFKGTEGEIYVNRGVFKATPEKIAESPITDRDTRLYFSNDHQQDFLNCVRSRQRPIADAEVGCRSVTICHLADLGYWNHRRLKWNPATERFVDDDRANTWLDGIWRYGSRRALWKLAAALHPWQAAPAG